MTDCSVVAGMAGLSLSAAQRRSATLRDRPRLTTAGLPETIHINTAHLQHSPTIKMQSVTIQTFICSLIFSHLSLSVKY